MIANPELGQQNAWPSRINLDFLAQVADDDAQVMRVVQMRPTPNLLHDLLTRYDPAGVLCENLQDKIFLRAKDKPLAVECPGAGGEVDFKQSDSDDRIAERYDRARAATLHGRARSTPRCRTV